MEAEHLARAFMYVVDYVLLYVSIASISAIISADNAEIRWGLRLVRICPLTCNYFSVIVKWWILIPSGMIVSVNDTFVLTR